MTGIAKSSIAGTVESNDIMIRLAPIEAGKGIVLELQSPVMMQYGEQIRRVILKALEEQGITEALVVAVDKGALDYTIRARVLTAVSRAMQGVRI